MHPKKARSIPHRRLPEISRHFAMVAMTWLVLWACQPSPDDAVPEDPAPTPPKAGGCTPAPPVPAGGPSDWGAAVRSNCFTNLERLEQWTGGTAALQNGDSPESGFTPLVAGSVGAGTAGPVSVTVLVHGWAPGYRSNVAAAGGKLKWWSDGAGNSSGVWPSAWAWVPTTSTDPALQVTATGVFQEIQAHDADAVVLGYSWTDDSATGGSFTTLDDVYRSEAYTNVNGLRLAAALEEALAPDFWTGKGNRLHLIGHSHGSKVVTVATLTLQQRQRRVDHLTVLDSPETEITLEGNGANLLGFYLAQLTVADPSASSSAGTFVDSYVSEFGAVFTGAEVLSRIVDVSLDPSQIYTFDEAGDKHSYSAAWYGGAAAAAASKRVLSPVGLDWPPPPPDYKPALNQKWSSGVTESEQWILTEGSSIDQVREFGTESLQVTKESASENVTVTGSPVESVELKADGGSAVFEGSYDVSTFSDVFGIAFEVEWTEPADGGYLVFTVESPELREQEVILVVDGKSMPTGAHPMSFNADISDTDFFIYYLPAAGNSGGAVKVSNFQAVISECESHCD